MNWALFWALFFAIGIIVGNILLLKQSAKLKMPKPKKPYAEWDDDDKDTPSRKQITPPEFSEPRQNQNNRE